MNKLGSVVYDKNHPWERYLVVQIAKTGKYGYLDLLDFRLLDASYDSLEEMGENNSDVLMLDRLELKEDDLENPPSFYYDISKGTIESRIKKPAN
jgi:hypothetical protein